MDTIFDEMIENIRSSMRGGPFRVIFNPYTFQVVTGATIGAGIALGLSIAMPLAG